MKSFKMESTEKKSRLLGLAFLIQFVTSFTAGVFVIPLATEVSGFGLPDNIGVTLAAIARNASLVRLAILMELVTAAAVIFLGAMLYSAVRSQHKGLALTAFGLYVMGGVLIAVKMLVFFTLLVFGRQFTAAGSPATLEPMGSLLYEVMVHSSRMLNFAFCLGLTIFYALLFKASTVSRPLLLWGLLSIQGILAGVILGFFGMTAPFLLAVPYIPFELVIAVWILVKGVKKEEGN